MAGERYGEPSGEYYKTKSIPPCALCFAAGAMIFVVVQELIPESQRIAAIIDLVTMATMVVFQ
jgi:ZIP family zinc transporter